MHMLLISTSSFMTCKLLIDVLERCLTLLECETRRLTYEDFIETVNWLSDRELIEASRRFPDSLKTFHYNDGQPIARGQFAVYLLPSLEGFS